MTLRIPESLFSGHTLKIADVRNQAILADTNILPDSLPPMYKPASFFMVYCCFENAGALAVRRTFTDLGVTKSEFLNEGFPFANNAAYIFAVEVSEDEEINFWYTNNTVATKLTVIESQIM
jgi:hypothetical protein